VPEAAQDLFLIVILSHSTSGARRERPREHRFPSRSAPAVLPQPFCPSRSAPAVLPQPFCPSRSAPAVLPQPFCPSRSAPAVTRDHGPAIASVRHVARETRPTNCLAPETPLHCHRAGSGESPRTSCRHSSGNSLIAKPTNETQPGIVTCQKSAAEMETPTQCSAQF
jgi:hypothetical protein